MSTAFTDTSIFQGIREYTDELGYAWRQVVGGAYNHTLSLQRICVSALGEQGWQTIYTTEYFSGDTEDRHNALLKMINEEGGCFVGNRYYEI